MKGDLFIASELSINITSCKDKLMRLRDELMRVEQSGNQAAETVELDQSKVGRLSRMDALRAQAMSVESKRRREITKQRIESALQRIEKKEYGLCLRCAEEIDPKRLHADPTALFCISCANLAEK